MRCVVVAFGDVTVCYCSNCTKFVNDNLINNFVMEGDGDGTNGSSNKEAKPRVGGGLLPPDGYYGGSNAPSAYGEGRGRRGGRGRGRGRGRGGDRGRRGHGHNHGQTGGHEEDKKPQKEPLHALEPVEDKFISEEDVGITMFASTEAQGFRAIVKHLYSDFNVNEITQEGAVVRLGSAELPETERLALENRERIMAEVNEEAQYAKLSEEDKEVLGPLAFARVQKLARKHLDSKENSAPSDAVSIDASKMDKEGRTKLHRAIKGRFPHLETKTESEGGASVIKVYYRSPKDGSGIRRPAWPKDRPRYLEFTLYKQQMDQYEAVLSLSRLVSANKKRFAFAGTKDRRARTTQRATAAHVSATDLCAAVEKIWPAWKRGGEGKVAAVGDFKYVDKELHLGDLGGNRFEVVLRNVDGDGKAVDAAFEALREHGFVNYFGLQRFGTTNVPTSDVGLALIKEDWKGAIEIILKPRANEKPWLRAARECWWQYRNPHEALRRLGKSNWGTLEGCLLDGLKKCDFDSNPMGALDFLPTTMRSMYLHAYQSIVFNRVASERMRRFGTKVLQGDMYVEGEVSWKRASEKRDDGGKAAEDEEHDSDNDDDTSSEQEEAASNNVLTTTQAEKVDIFDVVLPLPGAKVSYPDNEMKAIYEAELAKDGLDFDTFAKANIKYKLRGDYRKLMAKVFNGIY